jgi:hypothetical protein
MADKSELVVISKVQGQATADIIKSHLESEGIPVLLKYESSGAIYGILVDGVGEIRILVPKEFADEARHIIEPQKSEPEED